MSAFDHLRAGTTEQAWRTARWLDTLLPLEEPVVGDRVLVLAAHPDDETLGAGGLIAACGRRRIEVTVVVATDGEASHPNSSTLRPPELAALRRAEVRAAVEVLASGSRVLFLGLPDGRLTQFQTRLQQHLGDKAVGMTHLISPWRHDRHPDHEACAVAAARVSDEPGLQHWQYPIWAWHWDDPERPGLTAAMMRRFQLADSDLRAKLRAMDCHLTQHTPLSAAAGDEAILPPAITAHFKRDFETYIVAESAFSAAASSDLP